MTIIQRITDYPKVLEENRALQNANVGLSRNQHMFEERLAELELALDNVGWTSLTDMHEREFSREGLTKIARLSRMMYLANPLIRRAVNLRGYYTWGQGVEVNCEDKRVNELLQEHMDDYANSEDLYSESARLECDEELHNTGNLFHALFTSATGNVDIRSIPAEQITRIICNPEDHKDVWYYERSYWVNSVHKISLHPDVIYQPINQPSTYEGNAVNWDAPMVHLKAGGQKFMAFGVPETYPALDWAREHKNFLQDWTSLVRSLTRFAYRVTSANPELDKAQFDSTFARGNGVETNPAPLAGSILFGDEGFDMQAIPKTGATVAVHDSRELRLMIASAMDLPDTFLSGDVDVGNFATSKTLDRPTEMMIKFRQRRWASYWRKILNYVIEQQIRRGRIRGKKLKVNGREKFEFPDEYTIAVRFPDILEHDVTSRVTALISAATLDGRITANIMPPEVLARELLSALGIEDIDGILETMDFEESKSANLANAVRKLEEALKDA